MVDLTLTNLDLTKLIALGDAFVRVGDVDNARKAYQAAGHGAPVGIRRTKSRVRAGIATRNDGRLQPMLDVVQALDKIQDSHAFVGEGLATWFKQTPFFEDDRFSEIADRHAELIPLRNWQWNLQIALWAVQQARNVEGDYVELGVFKGHTTLFTAEYVEFQTWPKQWYLYDTFDGIPDDQLDSGWENNNNTIYKGTFGYDEVKARFSAFPNIQVIQGRVPEVLDPKTPERIAFMHVDMNNVTAEIAALDALFDRVSPGGVILFDDYLWGVSRAQYVAEKAWFAERGEFVLPLPTGQGLFIKT